MIEITVQGWVCGTIWWPYGVICTKSVSESVTECSKLFSYKPQPADVLLSLLLRHHGDYCGGAMFTADSVIIVRHSRHTFKGTVVRENVYPITKFPSLALCVNPDVSACDVLSDMMDSAEV